MDEDNKNWLKAGSNSVGNLSAADNRLKIVYFLSIWRDVLVKTDRTVSQGVHK